MFRPKLNRVGVLDLHCQNSNIDYGLLKKIANGSLTAKVTDEVTVTAIDTGAMADFNSVSLVNPSLQPSKAPSLTAVATNSTTPSTSVTSSKCRTFVDNHKENHLMQPSALSTNASSDTKDLHTLKRLQTINCGNVALDGVDTLSSARKIYSLTKFFWRVNTIAQLDLYLHTDFSPALLEVVGYGIEDNSVNCNYGHVYLNYPNVVSFMKSAICYEEFLQMRSKILSARVKKYVVPSETSDDQHIDDEVLLEMVQSFVMERIQLISCQEYSTDQYNDVSSTISGEDSIGQSVQKQITFQLKSSDNCTKFGIDDLVSSKKLMSRKISNKTNETEGRSSRKSLFSEVTTVPVDTDRKEVILTLKTITSVNETKYNNWQRVIHKVIQNNRQLRRLTTVSE